MKNLSSFPSHFFQVIALVPKLPAEGLAVPLPSRSACIHMRHQLYAFRKALREHNHTLCAEAEMMYIPNPQREGDQWVLRICNHRARPELRALEAALGEREPAPSADTAPLESASEKALRALLGDDT